MKSPGSDADGARPADADPSVGCAEGDGGSAFLGVLGQGAAHAQWDIERLNSKAKSTLITGATVLSVLTAGLVGFGGLLDGDISNLAALAPLPGWAAGLLPAFGAAGLGAILASMGLATKSLSTFDINNPVASRNFTEDGEPGPPDDTVLARCSRMTGDIVLGLYRSYIKRIGHLEKNGKRAGKLVRASQWFLYAGLVCVGIPPLLVLFSLARIPCLPW